MAVAPLQGTAKRPAKNLRLTIDKDFNRHSPEGLHDFLQQFFQAREPMLLNVLFFKKGGNNPLYGRHLPQQVRIGLESIDRSYLQDILHALVQSAADWVTFTPAERTAANGA